MGENQTKVDEFLKKNIATNIDDLSRNLDEAEIKKVLSIRKVDEVLYEEKKDVPRTLNLLRSVFLQAAESGDFDTYRVENETPHPSTATGQIIIGTNLPEDTKVLLTEFSKDWTSDEIVSLDSVARCACAISAVLSENGCYEFMKLHAALIPSSKVSSLVRPT